MMMMQAKIINPESSYFGMVGEVQQTPEQSRIGMYRIGLWVKDSRGNLNAMHWHFNADEVELVG